MKQKYDITQKGFNPDYPKEAYTWTLSQPVPEWLSDRAKVSGMTESGNPILGIRERTSGGVDILSSSGDDTLVTLKERDSIVLFSTTHPLMSVTPHQLELLYVVHLRD